MRRSRESGTTYWGKRLGEPGLTAAVGIEAGPPLLGPALGLGGAALILLVLGKFGLPESNVIIAACIVFLPLSFLAGGYVVRRAVAARWTDSIGTSPPMGMLLGVADDRLVIWRWPRRGKQPMGRLADPPLAEVTLRPRMALLGGLEIELPGRKTLFVNHPVGPYERQAVALIVEAVANARPL